MTIQEQFGHSAEVQMRLLVNGFSFPIAHMGPNYLRLRNGVEQPPVSGEVILVVDGHESRWSVFLPEGLHSGQERVPVAKAR
jgi:hypothetical protein